MNCRPQIMLNRNAGKPKISVILIDWGVRESFHSLEYLNRQTADRRDYELIWLEFYDHKPEALQRLVANGDRMLDKWYVLGYPNDFIYHKHRLYNIGILAAQGDICVICDSDAIFQPTFIDKLIQALTDTANAVVHLDEVRNTNRAFYPFNHPSVEDVLGPGCINWRNGTTLGLDSSPDMLHHANYGACMAAWRKDLLAIGGADEHVDYLGYVCGPYELTIRLLNYGRHEYWLRDEYLYHTWHPNQYGFNTDYHGPHDGMHLALLALDDRATFRVGPCMKNPWFPRSRWRKPLPVSQLLERAPQQDDLAWKAGAQVPADRVYWVQRDYYGFNIYHHAGIWYALRTGGGKLKPAEAHAGRCRELWRATTLVDLQEQLPIDQEQWKHQLRSGWLPARLWRKVRAQPLRRLPGRIARTARKLLQV
jgi:hypothetical protein